jgi:transcriptional regulator with XRE-family HTH domain
MELIEKPQSSIALLRNIGPRVAALRHRAGLSQVELSRRARVRQQSISKLEQCEYQPIPALDVLLNLARAFSVTPEQLLFNVVPPPTTPEEKQLMLAWRVAPPALQNKVMFLLWPSNPTAQ